MLTGDEIKELLEKGVIIRETPKDRNDGGTPSASVPKAGKVKIGKSKPKGA
jgi:hypothetical protein